MSSVIALPINLPNDESVLAALSMLRAMDSTSSTLDRARALLAPSVEAFASPHAVGEPLSVMAVGALSALAESPTLRITPRGPPSSLAAGGALARAASYAQRSFPRHVDAVCAAITELGAHLIDGESISAALGIDADTLTTLQAAAAGALAENAPPPSNASLGVIAFIAAEDASADAAALEAALVRGVSAAVGHRGTGAYRALHTDATNETSLYFVGPPSETDGQSSSSSSTTNASSLTSRWIAPPEVADAFRVVTAAAAIMRTPDAALLPSLSGLRVDASGGKAWEGTPLTEALVWTLRASSGANGTHGDPWLAATILSLAAAACGRPDAADSLLAAGCLPAALSAWRAAPQCPRTAEGAAILIATAAARPAWRAAAFAAGAADVAVGLLLSHGSRWTRVAGSAALDHGWAPDATAARPPPLVVGSVARMARLNTPALRIATILAQAIVDLAEGASRETASNALRESGVRFSVGVKETDDGSNAFTAAAAAATIATNIDFFDGDEPTIDDRGRRVPTYTVAALLDAGVAGALGLCLRAALCSPPSVTALEIDGGAIGGPPTGTLGDTKAAIALCSAVTSLALRSRGAASALGSLDPPRALLRLAALPLALDAAESALLGLISTLAVADVGPIAIGVLRSLALICRSPSVAASAIASGLPRALASILMRAGTAAAAAAVAITTSSSSNTTVTNEGRKKSSSSTASAAAKVFTLAAAFAADLGSGGGTGGKEILIRSAIRGSRAAGTTRSLDAFSQFADAARATLRRGDATPRDALFLAALARGEGSASIGAIFTLLFRSAGGASVLTSALRAAPSAGMAGASAGAASARTLSALLYAERTGGAEDSEARAAAAARGVAPLLPQRLAAALLGETPSLSEIGTMEGRSGSGTENDGDILYNATDTEIGARSTLPALSALLSACGARADVLIAGAALTAELLLHGTRAARVLTAANIPRSLLAGAASAMGRGGGGGTLLRAGAEVLYAEVARGSVVAAEADAIRQSSGDSGSLTAPLSFSRALDAAARALRVASATVTVASSSFTGDSLSNAHSSAALIAVVGDAAGDVADLADVINGSFTFLAVGGGGGSSAALRAAATRFVAAAAPILVFRRLVTAASESSTSTTFTSERIVASQAAVSLAELSVVPFPAAPALTVPPTAAAAAALLLVATLVGSGTGFFAARRAFLESGGSRAVGRLLSAGAASASNAAAATHARSTFGAAIPVDGTEHDIDVIAALAIISRASLVIEAISASGHAGVGGVGGGGGVSSVSAPSSYLSVALSTLTAANRLSGAAARHPAWATTEHSLEATLRRVTIAASAASSTYLSSSNTNGVTMNETAASNNISATAIVAALNAPDIDVTPLITQPPSWGALESLASSLRAPSSGARVLWLRGASMSDGLPRGTLATHTVALVVRGDTPSGTPVPWAFELIFTPRGDGCFLPGAPAVWRSKVGDISNVHIGLPWYKGRSTAPMRRNGIPAEAASGGRRRGFDGWGGGGEDTSSRRGGNGGGGGVSSPLVLPEADWLSSHARARARCLCFDDENETTILTLGIVGDGSSVPFDNDASLKTMQLLDAVHAAMAWQARDAGAGGIDE